MAIADRRIEDCAELKREWGRSRPKSNRKRGAGGTTSTIPYPLSPIAFSLNLSGCLPRIRDGFSLGSCSMLCGKRLTELLCCFGTLATRFVDRSLGHSYVDYSTFDKTPSLESVHVSALALAWIQWKSELIPTSTVALKLDLENILINEHHGKSPAELSFDGASSRFKSLAVTYSCMPEGHTTIGAQRFHFRVRYGIGWFPLAIAARQTGSRRGRQLH